LNFSAAAFRIGRRFRHVDRLIRRKGIPVEDARDLVDQTVLVKLTSNEGLAFAGVPDEGPFFCKVVAVDEIGIWVENRRFVTVEIRSSAGRYVPKRKQKPERHVVNLLIPWRIILTVVRFQGEAAVKAAVLGESACDSGRIGFVK
jgi:hypothetical protein